MNSDGFHYKPSQEIEDITPCHVKGRPQRKRDLETILIECLLSQTFEDTSKADRIKKYKTWSFSCQVTRYKSHLCTRVFTLVQGVDYQKIFLENHDV